MDQQAFARVCPRQYGTQAEPRRLFNSQILEAMNCDVDFVLEKSVFDLFGKEGAAKIRSQRDILNLVALGLEDDDLDVRSRCVGGTSAVEFVTQCPSLPKGEFAATGSDTNPHCFEPTLSGAPMLCHGGVGFQVLQMEMRVSFGKE